MSCLTTADSMYVSNAEKARGCGMLTDNAISIYSQAGAAIYWDIAPPLSYKPFKSRWKKLIHVPNTWYMEPQGTWAKLLSERSFGGQAFFCNSGTEANESAIKLVRLRSEGKRYKIIYVPGWFPWPYDGQCLCYGSAEIPRRIGANGRRFSICPTRRP